MATSKSTSGRSTTGNRQTRRAAPKAAPKTSDQPVQPGVVLSQLERESTGVDPFYVHLEGDDPIEIGDPQELPYSLLAAEANPHDAFMEAMTPEDYERFLDLDLKMWQWKKIFDRWREHYGLGTPGE